MNTLEGKDWPEKLMNMSVGQVEKLPWDKRRTIRGAISDRIKNDFPDFYFTTNKVEVRETDDNGNTVIRRYLNVRRIK